MESSCTWASQSVGMWKGFLLLLGGNGISGLSSRPLLLPPLHSQGEGYFITAWWGWKSSRPTWSPRTPWFPLKHQWGWKAWLPIQPLLLMVEMGLQVFLQCLAGVELFLLDCSFPGPLMREGKLLRGALVCLFVCFCWHSWVAGFSSTQFWNIQGSNRTQGIQLCAESRGP